MARHEPSERNDVYERVTNRIIEHLEQGTRPWMQPWGPGGTPKRPLRHNGVAYRGINTVLLWMTAQEKGYASRFWMTYRQAQELGGHVRKRERATTVVYAGAIDKTEANDKGEECERRIPFLKAYSVFCADQIEGLPAEYGAAPAQASESNERIETADRFFASLGADIRVGGSKAFYHPALDYIGMPPFAAFVSTETHAGTLGHECIHWTMHKDRLNRDLGFKKWGDDGYAREELVAELGSAFLAADLGIAIEPREDHAAYIQSWLKILKGDKRAVISAASHAEKAVAFLHGLQPAASTAPDHDELEVAA